MLVAGIICRTRDEASRAAEQAQCQAEKIEFLRDIDSTKPNPFAYLIGNSSNAFV